MGTNYIAPIWRMPRNANKDKLSNYNIKFGNNEVINFDSYTLPDKYTISIWLNPDASYGTSYGYYIGGSPNAGQGFAIGQGGNAYGMQVLQLQLVLLHLYLLLALINLMLASGIFQAKYLNVVFLIII